MLVLVTGGAGFIGSILIRELLQQGHKVKCLDRFFFGLEALADISSNTNLQLIKDDIRWFSPDLLDGVDVVIDLAALSNDPSCELDPAMTININYSGRVRVAKLSHEHRVKRYILASSCSAYGFRDEICDETTPTNALTTYAKANVMAENDVLALSDSGFAVSVLRFATVYGLSPRMRFDLALNGMTLGLFKSGKIPVMRNGDQWRPFIHIKDAVRAYLMVMESSPELVNGQIFNVGSDEQNHQISELARIVGDSIGIQYDLEWYGTPDNRSYRVSFEKIKESLNYMTRYTPQDGSEEIYNALKTASVRDSPKTYTVNWYRYLLSMNNCNLTKELMIKDTLL